MEKERFWQLVDESRNQAQGDADEQIEVLRTILAELEPAEIVAFDRLFTEYWGRAYTWELWAAAYIIGGGCSDDGFMDFRGWLIAKGEKVYENALINPESLAEVVEDSDEDGQVEGFQYVASQAWEKKTGETSNEYPELNVMLSPEPVGVAWEESDLEKRFPILYKKF